MSGLSTMRGWAVAVCLVMGSTCLSISTDAVADAGFIVGIDQAAMLSTVATPRTVIVGNPSIADVSVQRDRLVITGKAYGTTNLILLDESGATISEMPLTVVSQAPERVSVFKAGKRLSFTCVGVCNPELNIGDDNAFFDDVARQMGTKSGLATSGR